MWNLDNRENAIVCQVGQLVRERDQEATILGLGHRDWPRPERLE